MAMGLLAGAGRAFVSGGGVSGAANRFNQINNRNKQVDASIQAQQTGDRNAQQQAKVKQRATELKILTDTITDKDLPDEARVNAANELSKIQGLGKTYTSPDEFNSLAPTFKQMNNILNRHEKGEISTRDMMTAIRGHSAQIMSITGQNPDDNPIIQEAQARDKSLLNNQISQANQILGTAAKGGKTTPEDAKALARMKSMFAHDPERLNKIMAGVREQNKPEAMSMRSPAIRIAQERAKGTDAGDKFAADILEGKRATVQEATDKKTGSAIVKELPKLKKEAFAANNGIKRLNKMQELINTGNVTGKKGEIKANLAGWAELFGVKKSTLQGFSDAQLFQRLGRMIVGPLRLEIIGPGQVTEFEQRILQQMGGGGGMAAEAARELLTQYAEIAREKVELFNSSVDDAASLSPNTRLAFRKIKPNSSQVGQRAVSTGSQSLAGSTQSELEARRAELLKRKSELEGGRVNNVRAR